eukprot:XP_001186771.3 PREDICTED: uncharacterized protein LOC754712 [Strongylocentrotus purpuratus]
MASPLRLSLSSFEFKAAEAWYWLEPTAAAMAKLDEIQFSVESMKPASAFNVQSVWNPESSTPPPSAPIGRSPSSSKASPYTELETEPPLSTVSIQKTSAWGSNTSIPDLIKAQGERQKKPKGAPRRPWSGRKVPSSPTLQRRGSQTWSGDDDNKDTPGAFIAVKGAKSVMYDVGSRPLSGRSHPSSSSSSNAGPHNSSHDVFEMMEAANTARPTHGESATEGEDNALEEFLRSQPNGHKHELSKLSAAYADERNVTPPPPPPCASPDLEKLINGGLDEEDYYYTDRDHPEVEGHKEEDRDSGELYIHVTQPSYVPPQLLRRPTPEPLKLSMTIPDAEGEEDYSTDEDRSSGAPSPQLSPDIEVQSVTSEVSAQLTAQYITSQQNSPSHTHPLTPQGVDSTLTQDRGDEWDHHEIDASVGKSRKGRQSVKFVEERNVTFDITPRDCASTHKPSPPSVSRVQRPRSALKSPGVRKSIVQKKRPSSAGYKGSSQLAHGNSYSSGRLNHRDDEGGSNEESDEEQNVTNDELMDAINNNAISQLLDNLTKPRSKKEVETMMSQLAVSEANKATTDATKATQEVPQSHIVRTVQVSSSSPKQNYYEKAILAKKKSMYHRQNTPTRMLTTKVIEFGDEGPSMETKEVSYFQVVTPPSQVKVSRPTSSRGPRRGWEEPGASEGTHVNRPTMGKKSFVEQQIARPTSRIGSYQDLEDSDPLELDKRSPRSAASQRARPRSAVLKAKSQVSPHSCARTKSPNRTKPRPHSSFVNSNPPKKPVRRSSSPSAQVHSNSSRALVPTVRKSKAEVQRNREAFRALKDGSLKKTKTYGKQIVAVDDRSPVRTVSTGKEQQDGGKGSDSDSIDEYPKSMREEEVFSLHRHLTKSGVKISFKTLKRGLVAPNEKNANDCLDQLPSNVSLNLLSKPEAWLGETYRNYQIAENALSKYT